MKLVVAQNGQIQSYDHPQHKITIGDRKTSKIIVYFCQFKSEHLVDPR